MNLIYRLWSSLVLTAVVAFCIPVLLITTVLGILLVVGYIPGCYWLANLAVLSIWQFLTIFGNGYPLQGIITIGLTFAFVGGLFDLFNFYRYQTLKGD